MGVLVLKALALYTDYLWFGSVEQGQVFTTIHWTKIKLGVVVVVVFFAWLFAKQRGGTFILRIEDTDRERFVQEALDDILDVLRWLALPSAGYLRHLYGSRRPCASPILHARHALSRLASLRPN